MAWTAKDEAELQKTERTLAMIRGGIPIQTADKERERLPALSLPAGQVGQKTRPWVDKLERTAPVVPPVPLTIEQDIAHTWETSPAIREEFEDLAVFAAFKKAETAGKVKIIGGKVIKVKP